MMTTWAAAGRHDLGVETVAMAGPKDPGIPETRLMVAMWVLMRECPIDWFQLMQLVKVVR